MPDCPDRGKLEHENDISAYLVADNKNRILRDPDWRAWLGKEEKSQSWQGVVFDVFDQTTGIALNIPVIYLDEKVWKPGDRVKVTLERIEEAK